MNSNDTNLTSLSSRSASPVFACGAYTWILTETVESYTSILIKAFACPLTIFLNLLIIVAVIKRRELDKNSNILFSSMAVADLLVGAVSMPTNFIYEVCILLAKDLRVFGICRLASVNLVVLYGAASSSFYHLTVIAFERYVAIKFWTNYKSLITRPRVKCLVLSVWFLTLFGTVSAFVTQMDEINDNLVSILHVISGSKTLFCLALIVYCYISAYAAMRSRKQNDVSQISALSKAKAVESTIARAMAILTMVLLISFIPSVLFILRRSVPFYRTSTYFRWSQLLLQLNSLLNPLLYCFVLNRQFRKEVFKMLKIKSPRFEEPVAVGANLPTAERHIRRRIATVEFVEEREETQSAEEQHQDRSFVVPLNPAHLPAALGKTSFSRDSHSVLHRPLSRRATICGGEFLGKVEEEFQEPARRKNIISKHLLHHEGRSRSLSVDGPHRRSPNTQPTLQNIRLPAEDDQSIRDGQINIKM